jgi:starch-binding outer membrane protein, SusD/RagB family
MKENIIKASGLAFLVILLTAGCSKNFLEKPQGGTFTVDTVFHTKLNADAAIAQMYNLSIPTWFATTAANDMPRPDMVTDELYFIHPSYD